MPTLDLLTPAGHSDAWHQVRAPGGYEWWYFDGEDASSDTQIVAILLDGFVFHPGYLRRYQQYLRKPTRNLPPLPRDYPCAYFVIYERGKIAAQFMTQFPPGALQASGECPEVRMGENVLKSDGGKLSLSLVGTPWQLTARGPQTLRGEELRVNWTLTPTFDHPAQERTFLSREMTGASHHWVLANPHCSFTAEISRSGPEPRTWKLAGRAYHDHNYGTGPLGPGLARWIWGRALFEDVCYTFHHAIGVGGGVNGSPESHLVRVDAGGVTDLTPSVTAEFDRRTAVGLAYPGQLAFGSVMSLSQPRVIDSSPFYMRLIYAAECEGKRGTALCEVAYPHRLLWPVLGRMIEMSIDVRRS